MKKKKEVRFRHHFMTRLILPFVSFFTRRSYKLKLKKYKALKKKGPFVVLGNHTINVDPIVMGLHFPFHLYYIATEQVFNLGILSKVLKFIVNPIKKAKSISDMETIRKTKRIVEQGGSIGIFPEGNTTLNGLTAVIQPSTVKLIKLLKIPVIILNTKGLYLSFPRWSVYRKKGRTESYIRKIILPEMYLKLTEEAFYEELKNLLSVDAYEDQEISGYLYKGKKIAHGLEKVIFMDLKTHKPFVTYSDKDTLKSQDSDFSLRYLPTGKLLSNEGITYTLPELEKDVKLSYFNFYKNVLENKLFEETGLLIKTHATKRNKLGQYNLTLNKDSLILSKRDEQFKWHFDEVTSIAMQGKYQILVYLKSDTFLIKLDTYSSLYKYVLTYQYYHYIKLGGTSIYDNDHNFGI